MTPQEYNDLQVGDKISYKAEKCGEYWWWNIATVKGKASGVISAQLGKDVRPFISLNYEDAEVATPKETMCKRIMYINKRH